MSGVTVASTDFYLKGQNILYEDVLILKIFNILFWPPCSSSSISGYFILLQDVLSQRMVMFLIYVLKISNVAI